jgi:hypothetical protein
MDNKPWTEVTARVNRYKDIEAIFQWCEDNCTSGYRVMGVPGTAFRRVRFESVDDAILFALKWA